MLASSLGLVGCPTAAELEDPGRFEVFQANVPAGCEQALPSGFSCDVPAVIEKYCSRGGCHAGSSSAARLDLKPNEGLIARILEIPATHAGLTCPGAIVCDASMATCEECDACPENALLVSRSAPTESFILKKMEPFVPGTTLSNVEMHCGDAMPSFFTNAAIIREYSASEKQCLTDFFLEIATNTPYPERWPCTAAEDGGAPDGGT